MKKYEGFVTPSKQTVKILADGSAKVDYYYVRKETKVTFINASTKKEVTYLYGKENQAFTNNGFSKTGYTLTGYSDKENGSKNYEVTNTVTGEFIDTNYPSKTIYAVFTANTYKVIFNNNGGSGSMDTITCTYDKDCELSKNTFTKTGYTFAGWSKTSDGEIEYTNNETTKNLATSGNIILYAKWTANTYTITYNANGGSGSMNKTTCTYDTECTIAGNGFERIGYTFVNWTKDSATGIDYAVGSTVKNLVTSGNIDMYAKWNINSYKVTINTTKMSSSSSSFDLNYNDSNSITITPNSEYYISSGSCTNGYTISGLTTGTSATSAQTITINNNGNTVGSTCTFIASSSCPYTSGTVLGSYDYSGASNSLAIPCSGTYTMEVYGAQGGNYGSNAGGLGGSVVATFSLAKGEVMTINTGGQNGYNGGGSASAYGVGGGMTYINSNTKGTLLIAGGGGGATVKAAGGAGGTGGGVSGNTGVSGQAGGGAGGSGGTAGSYSPATYGTQRVYVLSAHSDWANTIKKVNLVSGTAGGYNASNASYPVSAPQGSYLIVDGENWYLESGLNSWSSDNNPASYPLKFYWNGSASGIGVRFHGSAFDSDPDYDYGWRTNGIVNLYQDRTILTSAESSIASKGGTNYVNTTYATSNTPASGVRSGNGYAKITLTSIN